MKSQWSANCGNGGKTLDGFFKHHWIWEFLTSIIPFYWFGMSPHFDRSMSPHWPFPKLLANHGNCSRPLRIPYVGAENLCRTCWCWLSQWLWLGTFIHVILLCKSAHLSSLVHESNAWYMHGSLLFSSLVNFGFSALLVAPFFPFPPPLEGPGAAFTAADEEVPPWPLESSLLGSSFFSFLGFDSFFNLSFGSLSGFLSGLSAFARAAAGSLSSPPCCFQRFFDKRSILILLREFNCFINFFHQRSWLSLTRPFSSWSVLVNRWGHEWMMFHIFR